jgi:hypothetical protein
MTNWIDKTAASLVAAKDTLIGTFNKVAGVFGYEFDAVKAAKMVDETTDAVEIPLTLLIEKMFPLLPPAIAQGAAKHALDYVDAAVAGMLAAKKA